MSAQPAGTLAAETVAPAAMPASARRAQARRTVAGHRLGARLSLSLSAAVRGRALFVQRDQGQRLADQGYTLDWYRELLDDTTFTSRSGSRCCRADRRRQWRSCWAPWPRSRSTASTSPANRRSGSSWSCRSRCPGSSPAWRCFRSSRLLGWPLSRWTIIIGHATFCITLVLNNVVARLGQIPRSLDEASADLGAPPVRTFWRVTFPLIRPAILAGAILAFTLSFDEVVVTFFLPGGTRRCRC